MRLGLGLGCSLSLVFMGLGSGACHSKTVEDQLTPGSAGLFRNPIAGTGADPWVIYHAGFYYYCQTNGKDAIFVSQARNLFDIGRVPAVKVWQAPPGTEHSRQLWAAELHFLDGRWYIYYAASDGDNDSHRMFVLESANADPSGAYHFKGKIAAATDRWAIDGTVLDPGDGQRYFIWSGWDGTNNIQQNLYIAPMLNPWTLQPPDQAVLRLEAEQARIQGAAVRSTRYASEGLAVGQLEGPESFIDFSFDMPQSGTYQIDVRYSNGTTIESSQGVTINDGRKTLSYPSFGPDNFQTVQVFAPLVAGSNRLRFTPGKGRVDLDRIEIKKAGSDRVVLSMPEHDYERRGGPAYVNEGPQVLTKKGRIHIIYSGSASWTDDYNLIQLSFQGGDILNRDNWEKRGTVFGRTTDVFGPGHASFTQSPDGKEDWIVYHAAQYQGAGWKRDVRAQPFTWDANGHPVFGSPLSLVNELPLPSGSFAH